MITYDQALEATGDLLDAVGETYWRDNLREDARLWRAFGDATHHIAKYGGGMGSFNDVLLIQANGFHLSREQEPWVNYVFDWLRSLCRYLASSHSHSVTASQIEQDLGRMDSSFGAFANATEETEATRREQVRWLDQQLEGWRCRSCGLAEVTLYNIEWFLAARFVPRLLARAYSQSDLSGVVQAALEMRIPDLSAARTVVRDAIARSGINERVSEGWSWTCPRCGSDRTGAYRWSPAESNPLRFVPAANNLPFLT